MIFGYFPELVARRIGVTLSACRRALDDLVQFLHEALKPGEVLLDLAIWNPTTTPRIRAGANALAIFARRRSRQIGKMRVLIRTDEVIE